MPTVPLGLRTGGDALWRAIVESQDLDAGQLATLEQACRQRDRADVLAPQAAIGDLAAIRHERDAALSMARLLAALRLPDTVGGKRPARRQLRGVQQPSAVSSLERARQAKTGA